MKKYAFILIILVALFATSCRTTLYVDTLVPADVNLGDVQTFAVAGTSAPSIAGDLKKEETDYAASYASRLIYKALSEGEYGVLESDITDSLIAACKKLKTDPTAQLINAGADVLIQSSFDTLDWHDEFRTKVSRDKKTGVETTTVYVDRRADVALDFTIWDLASETVIDTFTLTGRADDSAVAVSETGKDGKAIHRAGDKVKSPESLYEQAMQSFSRKIRDRLIPHYERVGLSLMKDKSKDEALKQAFETAKNGDLRVALRLFEDNWKKTHSTVSGYNAAILMYTLGEYEDAVTFAENVYDVTGNGDCLTLANRFANLIENQEYATLQLEGKLERDNEGSRIPY